MTWVDPSLEARVVDHIECLMREDSERWFPRLHSDEHWDLVIAYTLGLAGEIGEVANLIKKMNRDFGAESRGASDHLAEELADVFTYLLLLADELDVDLVAEWRAKRSKNEKRWGGDVA